MRTQKKVEKMRRALMRSNTRLLLTAVVIFQALAMLLIALKPETASLQPLIFAAAIPLTTILVTNLMGRIWPVRPPAPPAATLLAWCFSTPSASSLRPPSTTMWLLAPATRSWTP